jgi:2-iminobutanoate/2-iminopropanoate deaminase
MTAMARQEFRLPHLGEPISHYTDAVSFGQLLFVSGRIGIDPVTQTFQNSVVDQARQIFHSIGQVLSAAGASYADVLKVTVFLTDINDREKINPVRREFFGAHRPASTLVEVSRLARPEAKIEVEAVAGLPPPKEGRLAT